MNPVRNVGPGLHHRRVRPAPGPARLYAASGTGWRYEL